jgi:hypothetical protein
MHHPFEKLYATALRKSNEVDNRLLLLVKDLQKKGYAEKEIHETLLRFHKSLVADKDSEITQEALDALHKDEEE